jgi:hypothetical protein
MGGKCHGCGVLSEFLKVCQRPEAATEAYVSAPMPNGQSLSRTEVSLFRNRFNPHDRATTSAAG